MVRKDAGNYCLEMEQGSLKFFGHCTRWFFSVSLTQIRITWEERISMEELARLDRLYELTHGASS